MMTGINRIISRQQFFPGFLGILVNPFYFARKGLYVDIKDMAHYISGKVLDVGCGQKPYQELFSVDEYVGMDIEKPGQAYKYEGIDIFYDGKKFPFPDQSFDAVLSNEVLEHVFNPAEHLAEIFRVLKPGACFLVTVPFMWDEHEPPYDYARYSSFGVRYLLEHSGFEIVEQRKTMSDIRAVFQMINTYFFKKTRWMRKKWYWDILVTILVNAPVNVMGSVLARVLPKNPDLYLDNIVIARKPGS